MADKFTEKRKFARVHKNSVISIIYKSEAGGLQTEGQTVTEDIGAGGVRISLPEELAKDKVLDLQVFLFSDPLPLPAKGKVIWSKEKQKFEIKTPRSSEEEEKKNYWVGIQFIDIDPLTRERIIRLVKKEFLAESEIEEIK